MPQPSKQEKDPLITSAEYVLGDQERGPVGSVLVEGESQFEGGGALEAITDMAHELSEDRDIVPE